MAMEISGAMSLSKPQITSGASSRMGPSKKMSNLFEKIDSQGTGSVSREQFNKAFETLNPPKRFKSMSADQVFDQLTTNKTNSVAKSDFVSAMTQLSRSLIQGQSQQPASAAAAPSQTLMTSLQSFNGLGGNVDMLV